MKRIFKSDKINVICLFKAINKHIKKLLPHLFSGTIRRELLLAFFLIIVIPITTSSIVSFFIVEDVINQKSVANSALVFYSVSSGMDQIMRDMLMTSNSLILDLELSKLISEINKKDTVDQHFDKISIIRKFTSAMLLNLNSYSQSIVTISTGEKIYSSAPVTESNGIYSQIVKNENIPDKKNYIKWIDNTYMISVTGAGANKFILLSRRYLDYRKGKELGNVFIGVGINSLQNYLQSLITSEGSASLIINNNGEILTSAGDQTITKALKMNDLIKNSDQAGFNTLTTNNGQLVINYQKMQWTGWKLVQVIPKNIAAVEVNKIRNILLCLNSGFSLIFIFVAFLIVNKISKPVLQISAASKKVALGDLKVRVSINGAAELKQLGHNFNYMISKIQELIEQNKLSERQKREFELQALYAQINPHFLFNALNSMKFLADASRIYNVSKFITALADLLKNSIINKNESITIQDEILNVKSYIMLYNLRFLSPIIEEYDIEEDILGLYILKLILQPIVENSIIHGFDGIDYIGKIKITGRTNGDTVSIIIQDNGLGISEDKLKELLKECKPKDGKFSGIGISNVEGRLKLHFGEEYGINIQSTPGKGTITEIRFPAER